MESNAPEMASASVVSADANKQTLVTSIRTTIARLISISVKQLKVVNFQNLTVLILFLLECTLCLNGAKKLNFFDDGSDFVVREECGVKCPSDFEELQMRRDGLYILINAKEHFTEEAKVNAVGSDMMRCVFETIIDGESCKLEAFMGRTNRFRQNSYFFKNEKWKKIRKNRIS